MSIRNIQQGNLGARHMASPRPIIRPNITSPVTPQGSTAVPWKRNPSWPALPTVLITDQKFVGLYAVWPDSPNFCSFTVSGAYTVDWGDGSATQNFTTGSAAYYSYSYSTAGLANTDAPVTFTDAGDLVTRNNHGYQDGDVVSFFNIVSTTGLTSGQYYYVINATTNTFQVSATQGGSAIALTNNGSGTLLPYKLAIVSITPQAGQNLTALSLVTNHNQSGLATGYASGWLDISLSMPNGTAAGLVISNNSGSAPRHRNLEQVNILTMGARNSTQNMFFDCNLLQSINLFDTSLVTNMNGMFQNCYALETVPLYNSSAVTNMSSMFGSCYSIKSVPLFNTSNVTNMSNMFLSCRSLESVPLFDTSKVTDMNNMFNGCHLLENFPLFNTAAATNMSQMFQSCVSLKSVPFFNTSNVTATNSMFNLCSSLETVPLFDTSKVTNMSSMFQNCYSLKSVPLFNTSLVTNMGNMFGTCTALESVPLFNTSNVTTMASMFNACNALQSVPLFDTSKVTLMSNMFNGAQYLASIPSFNTALVTDMNNMFTTCFALQEIPLLNTANVTNMINFVSGCRSLRSVPTLNVTAVNSAANLVSTFANCPSITRIEAKDFRFTFSVASNQLSGTSLNEIYNNLPVAVGQTITVTGNYGLNQLVGNATQNGTTANNSPIITALTSTTGMEANQRVSGTNIPANAYILTVDSGTQITISANATGSATVAVSVFVEKRRVAQAKGWTVTP